MIPVAPCVFLGIQEGIKHLAPKALFNLTGDMAWCGYKFRAGSTVTEHSIIHAGYVLPEAVAAEAKQAMRNWQSKQKTV